ncbi:MAG: hypothetical protein KC933_18570 [Myxococcales bacterium]|nr:hypothetical protein [Myxococcales bacterium]MCB9651970.1 hypothetical protein [Deltaproteobacteria bacterium]
MKHSKLTFAITALLLALNVAGCGQDPNDATSTSDAVRARKRPPAPTPTPTAGSVMFTTSTTFKGALATFGGGSAFTFGDAECQRRADAAGIAGHFSVVLCDSTSNAVDRLSGAITYPVVNVAGDLVEATNIFDGTALAAPLLQEDGAARTSSWSGCTSTGVLGRKTCRNWTYFLSSDRGVTSWGADAYWLGSSGLGSVCNSSMSLLCIQTGP